MILIQEKNALFWVFYFLDLAASTISYHKSETKRVKHRGDRERERASERGRERQRERQREKDREKLRQTDRQAETDRDR